MKVQKIIFDLKWFVIVIYYLYVIILLISFNIYLKSKMGKGLTGRIKIPKNLLWIFIIGFSGAWIMILIPIVFLFYPDIVNIIFLISFLENTAFEIIGICLIIVGCIFMTISMLQLGLSARFYLPRQKTKLITSGIYRFCRNPVYMGFYISFIGIFFLLPSIISLICFCVFLISQHLRILQEEKFLTESFGDEYEKYTQEVGRYFPKILKK